MGRFNPVAYLLSGQGGDTLVSADDLHPHLPIVAVWFETTLDTCAPKRFKLSQYPAIRPLDWVL